MTVIPGLAIFRQLWAKAPLRYGLKILLTIAIISVTWYFMKEAITPFFHWAMDGIYETNTSFLQKTELYTEKMLLSLAGLHAGLSVLQSSEFGVSFIIDANVQLGQIIEQLTSIVGHGRDFSMLNLATLFTLNILLKVLHGISPLLLFAGVLGVAMVAIAELWLSSGNRWYHGIIRCGESAFVISCLLTVIIPLAVTMAAWTSETITHAIKQDSHVMIDNAHKEVLGVNDSKSDVREFASTSMDSFKKLHHTDFLSNNGIASKLTRYIAAAVIEVFLIPGMFTMLILWALRSLVHRRYSSTHKTLKKTG